MPWLSSELPDSPSILGDFQSLIAPILSYKGFCCPTFHPKYLNSEVQIGFYHILQPDQPYRLHLTQTYSRWCLYPGWKELCYHCVSSQLLCVAGVLQGKTRDTGVWQCFATGTSSSSFSLWSESTFSIRSVHSGLSAPNPVSLLALAPLPEHLSKETENILKNISPDWFFKINFFWPCHDEACGILVPQPGIQPMPPALEVQCLNHWTTREVPDWFFFFFFLRNFF